MNRHGTHHASRLSIVAVCLTFASCRTARRDHESIPLENLGVHLSLLERVRPISDERRDSRRVRSYEIKEAFSQVDAKFAAELPQAGWRRRRGEHNSFYGAEPALLPNVVINRGGIGRPDDTSVTTVLVGEPDP